MESETIKYLRKLPENSHKKVYLKLDDRVLKCEFMCFRGINFIKLRSFDDSIISVPICIWHKITLDEPDN